MGKTDEQKVVEIIKSAEEVADKILVNKQELVELDKRRQQTREAVRELEKNAEDSEKKVWITVGSMLVKLEKAAALKLLKNDQMQIEREINIMNSEQKLLVNKHRDLEHFSPYSGTQIKALDRKEFVALKANLPLL
ncbi:p53 and DNA damage-regulated protein 1 [Eurosta solidaginis]|uniref:p53 and DNA damage-regulated protein 1 n=1 Tax=Eurosta solidaginis TaxID=178769 RepID=UPI003530ED5C